MSLSISCDFETSSASDLGAAGAHIYSKHPTTRVLCLAYAFGEEPPRIWRLGIDPPPTDLFAAIVAGARVNAWNAAFERLIWANVCVPKLGWPALPDKQLFCTMVRAYAQGIPGKLEKAAPALGLEIEKDMVGNRVMRLLASPRETQPLTFYEPNDTDPKVRAKFETLYAYCKQDVEVERAAEKRLRELIPFERDLWLLDQKINDRGVAIDVKAATHANRLVELEESLAQQKIQKLSGGQITTPNSQGQIKDFLVDYGVHVPSIAKADVLDMLADPALPAVCREVLLVRQASAKTSVAKLNAMLQGADPVDHRVRGTIQYYGAYTTGRFAGRRLQTQNFVRGKLKHAEIETVFSILHGMDGQPCGEAHALLSALFDSPLGAISQCLRGFIVAAPGHDFVVSDWNAIEARMIAWLAGEETTLAVFRGHGKIYEHTASDIFGVPMEKVSSDERQAGKQAVLGLGFNGGVGALQKMAKAYGFKYAPVLASLLKRASNEMRERTERSYALLKSRYTDISRDEFFASDLIKQAWRLANPRVVQYWRELDAAATQAVSNPGVRFPAGPDGPAQVSYVQSGSFLLCRLPSGRNLVYPYPRLEMRETPWGDKREVITYMAEDQAHRWVRQPAAVMQLVENITQAASRDILAYAMPRVEAAGYPIVLHTHDELICELPKGRGSVDELSAIMATPPKWAATLPLAAAGYRAERYRK